MDAKHINFYVDDRLAGGAFLGRSSVCTDPGLFELEMKYVFERTWSFLAIDSQMANPNDFVSAQIGRTPVLVTLTPRHQIKGFNNACRHKREPGIYPDLSVVGGFEMGGETGFHACHRQWTRLMEVGLSGRKAYV